MNNNYSQSSLKGLLPGRRWLLLLSLVFLTANVFGQARNYQFAQSSAAYTEITGGTASTATGDDGTQAIPMPFPFTYAGTAVTDITIGTNGFVRMVGGAIFASNWTNVLSSTASLPVLAPFWDDHHLVAASGTIVYATTGTAPNRQLEIEFRNLVTSGSGSSTATTRARFKVTLFETSNQIVYHYGTSSATTTLSGSIGMNSAPGGVGQFLSVTPGVIATVSTGVENNTNVTLPDSGVVYTFTPSPASCGMPWALASSAITQTGFSFNWRNAGSTSYQYVATTTPTAPTGAGTAVSDTFVAISGLTPSTAYYVYVRSVCTGGTNSAWAGPVSVTTGGPVTSIASGLWSNPATWSSGSVPTPASIVTIATNDSVIFDLTANTIESLTINGVLGVNAAAARTLTVNGNVSVSASGSLNFGVPTTGTALRILDVVGNFTNAGNSNMANGNAGIRFIGTAAQTFTNSGALTNNAVGQLIISNAAGVTLASPVTIGFNLDLVAGVFTAGSNLTFDHVAVTGTSSQVRRSPLGSLVGTPTITSTVHNVQYVFFTGQTSALITEGPEMPASRSINALTISNPAGLNLTGNLTLTAAATALTLTNGIIHLPAGGKIICSNSAYAPTVGSATSFVNGGLEVVVSSATAVSRNFPIGSVVTGVPVRGHVVIAGMITGAGIPQSVTVVPVGAPSGGGVSPMGPRAFEVTATGSIGTAATVALNWDARDAVSFAGSLANIRIVQASDLTGPWTAISVSTTAGSLTGVGTRTTTAIDLANGGFFAWGTAASGDVAVTNLISPVSGACFGQSETVVAVLRNEGASIDRSANNIIVKGTVTTPGGTIINLTNVVRNAGTFALGQTDTITFSDALNMVDSGNYVVRVFIDSLTASLRTNDTLTRIVRSDAWTARANPSQIITFQASTVEVLRNGVVAANAGVLPRSTAAVRISEVIVFRTGTGAQPLYPAYVPAAAQDFLEFTNFGDTAANIGGWNLEIFGTGARTYTFPAGTVLPAGGVLLLHVGTGTDDVANRYYNTGGANDALFSTSTFGVTIRNGTTLVDAVAFRGFAFPATAGVSPADWSGNSPTTSSAGLMLVNFDNNNASNWVISTATLFTNIGAFNPNISVVSRNVSWTGPAGFTATGYTAATGIRNVSGVEQYTATITGGATCVRTAIASLQVVTPVTPVAGFTRSSTTATTGAVVSTVTLTDTSLNIPFQRRWTITPNTVTFVNGTNDSSIAPQVQFTAVGSYAIKLLVSNPAGADSLTVSNAVTVSLGYCASNATSTADTKIDSVMLGTALTGTASNTCQTYTNFTDSLGVVAIIPKTQPFPMMVRSGYCGTSGFAARGRVFIDINKDGAFTANEAVADFGPLTATGTASAREWFSMNLVVPLSADTGIARLRIVYREGATTFDDVLGCGTYSYGETEDYLVRITNPTIANPVLASPANNTFLNVNGPDQVRVNINWTPATRFTGTGAPATYTWQLASRAAGNFNAPLLSLASNNAGADTALTLTLAQLDAALASLNVPVGDTVRGIWRVRAITGTDTLFSAQTWNIDIRRGTITEAVTAFGLLTPPNFTILPVVGPGSQTAQIRWTTPTVAGSAPVTYQWLAIAPGGNFNAPVVSLNANGNGSDTSLTLNFAAVDALLASLNFNVGDSVFLDWTVRATSGSFTRLATQTWRITLFRGGIAPVRLAVAPVGGGGTTGLRAPNGTSGHTFFRGATFVPQSELAAAGIDSGAIIASMALRTTAGASSAARGKLTLLLSNGQNATYTRGTAWAGAITGLNIHHDDSVTIQTGVGTMTMSFSQPFVYTGGSIEVAYEWNGSAPFATTGAVYTANTSIANSLVSAASATAAPTTLGLTAFRPEFIWGVDDRKANEVEVITMFAKGRNPRNFGTPESIQAIVRNNGYQVRTNVPVTLGVAGANTFTNVQTIPSLGIDSTQLVTFSAFTGTSVGFNNMTVSVPADNNNANNSRVWAQEQTDSIFSYNDTVTVGNGAVGYNTGAGLLLSRFSINGTRSVAAARIRIGDGAAIAGNSVFAVVLNDSGVIVSQSGTVALTAADLRTWVVFPFPAPVNVTNGNFYIGLAQTANAVGYFPVAFQNETPTRANAYFTGPVAGGVVPSPVAGFRLMIEAHVGPEFVPADTLSRFNLVAPANNTTLNIQGDPAQTAQIRWRTSRRVGGVGTTTYEWLLDVPAGDFSNPVLRVSAGTDTSLTLTYGQIVDSLAARGVPVGGGFSGRWIVRATNGPVSRLANIPFTITLNRGVMTSIEETDFSKSISLYPNPAAYSAKLQINTPGDKELSIVIVNAVGQEMKKFNVNSSIANDIELDLTSLTQGLYFVRVTDGNEMAIKRLMIQR